MTWAERSAAQAVFSFDRAREVHAGQVSVLFEDQTAFPDLVSEIVTEEPSGDETSLVCGFPSPLVTETIFPDDGDPFEASAFYNQHFHARIGDFWKETSGDTVSGTRARAIVSWGGPVAATPDFSYGYPAYSRRGDNGKLEYMPAITVSLGTARWQIRVYPDADGLEQSYGAFTYKFLGNTYTCPIYASNTIADTDPSFSNTLSVNAILEAIEYWPYEVNDGGGPIYDPDTGERLR